MKEFCCLTSLKKISVGIVAAAGFGSLAFGAEKGAIYDINIETQSTASALMKLARDTGVQIIFPNSLGRDTESPALAGQFTLDQALGKILAESNLQYEFTDEKTLVVRAAEGGKSGSKTRDMDDRKDNMVEEIIVTAQKRGAGTSIQDTAMAITAIGGETVEKRGLVGMADYLGTLPGVSVQDRGAGQNSIVIRGVAASPQTETEAVGTYFGEFPLGGARGASGSGAASSADLKLVDIGRIEVLRGPQGTLYGSGSMGGTVRVMPKAPNLESLEGQIATRMSQTGGPGGTNTMVQGVLNLPLIEDTLAIRAVAYKYNNSGYIESVTASSDQIDAGVAAAVAQGGVAREDDEVAGDDYLGYRISALWQASENLDITLSHIRQDIDQDGFPEVNLNLPGKFQQARIHVGQNGLITENLSQEFEATNLVINYDAGWGTFTSSTAAIQADTAAPEDVSFVLFIPVEQVVKNKIDHFVQELRFSSDFDGPFQVLAGMYIEDIDTDMDSALNWTGNDPAAEANVLAAWPLPADAPPGFAWSDWTAPIGLIETTEQKAFFAEFAWEFTDQLALTVGGRHFDYEQKSELITGAQNVFSQNYLELRNATGGEEKGQNYKVNLTFTPSEDVLLYGQWSEGFRIGTTQFRPQNPQCYNDDGLLVLVDGSTLEFSSTVKPDNLESFEFGFKTSLAENRVTLNGAIYRINWEGIPVAVLGVCGTGVTINAGKSTAEGIELESKIHLADDWRLDLSASYGTSTLAEQSSIGNSGDDLPGSADFNMSAGLEYDFTLAGHDAFARLDYSYQSEYYNNTRKVGEAAGGYGLVNVKSGVRIGKIDIDLFVHNLLDEDGFTWVETVWSTLGSPRAYRQRPRTAGVNLAYHF